MGEENRQSRRAKLHKVNHNFFTKKYKSNHHREVAFMNFIGIENYNNLKKKVKEQRKQLIK